MIDEEQAKERQGKRNDLENIPENLPACSTGDARDQAGKAFGVRGDEPIPAPHFTFPLTITRSTAPSIRTVRPSTRT